MTHEITLPELPERMPVFPLPDVVLFPGTVLPLHVFEPRYRDMIRDASRGAGVLAMALLKPGWEPDYEGTPEVYHTGCAGRIEELHRTPDGRYHFQLRALHRVRFLDWDLARPYRIARCQPIPERPLDDSDPAVAAEKLRLLGTFAALLREVHPDAVSSLAMDAELPAAVAINRMAMGLEFDAQVKQRLLDMDDVGLRGRFLVELMETELHRALQKRRRGETGTTESGEN